MTESLIWGEATSSEVFHEQRRHKWTASDNETVEGKESNNNPGIRNRRAHSQVPTRNFLGLLRTHMEFEDNKEDPNTAKDCEQQQVPRQAASNCINKNKTNKQTPWP
jgi:hypothetical protein